MVGGRWKKLGDDENTTIFLYRLTASFDLLIT
jgi:hypothetical protein